CINPRLRAWYMACRWADSQRKRQKGGHMQAEETEMLKMISEGSPVPSTGSATERAKQRWPRRKIAEPAEVPPEDGTGRIRSKLESVAERLGRKYLELLGRQGRVSESV